MVVEKFRFGAEPVYKRSAEQGRMLPDGLAYIDSWVDAELRTCFQLMETDRPELFDEWIARWDDLVEFEVVPVLTSADAARRASG
jgi:hypothetical protein